MDSPMYLLFIRAMKRTGKKPQDGNGKRKLEIEPDVVQVIGPRAKGQLGDEDGNGER